MEIFLKRKQDEFEGTVFVGAVIMNDNHNLEKESNRSIMDAFAQTLLSTSRGAATHES